MKSDNYITFLSTYWQTLNLIQQKIVNELPKLPKKVQECNKNSLLHTIQYKNLEHWDVSGFTHSESNNLKALANKISHMIYKGDAINLQPMLFRICFKGIKKISTHEKHGNNRFLGYGHFRWNYCVVYTLTTEEIQKVIHFFNLKQP